MALARTLLPIFILSLILSITPELLAENHCRQTLSQYMTSRSICGGSYPVVADTDPDCPAPLAKITDVDDQCNSHSYCMLYDRAGCPMEIASENLNLLQPVYSDGDVSMLKSSQFLNSAYNNTPDSYIPTENSALIQIPKTVRPLQIKYIRPLLISTSDCLSGRNLLTDDLVFCPETNENPFYGQYILKFYRSDSTGQPLPTPVIISTFEIDQNTLLPVQNPSGAAAIIRGPVIDTSAMPDFVTDTAGPVYIGIQLNLITNTGHAYEQIDDDNSSRYDKMIYMPYAETLPLTSTGNTDWIRQDKPGSSSAFFPGNYTVELLTQGIETPPYEIKHFASEYTLAEPNNVAHTISSCEELQDLNGSAHTEIELGNDIDCSSITNFEPIVMDHVFTFDGNNKRILNLSINGVGLFPSLMTGSIIENVIFEHVTIESYEQTGLLSNKLNPSQNNPTTRIQNVHIAGSQNLIRGGFGPVGGLIAEVSGETSLVISDSTVNSRIYGNSYRIGGLVGQASNTEILRSFSTGHVSPKLPFTTGGASSIGGLVGLALKNVLIDQSASSAMVGGLWQTGGLVGVLNKGSAIRDSFFNGQLIGMQSTDPESGRGMGGVAGIANGSLIQRTYSAGTISGRSAMGGIVGKLDLHARVIDSFSVAEITVYPFEGQYAFNPIGTAGGIAGEVVESFVEDSSYTSTDLSCVSTLQGFPIESTIDMCVRVPLTTLQSQPHSDRWNITHIWEIVGGHMPQLRNIATPPVQ